VATRLATLRQAQDKPGPLARRFILPVLNLPKGAAVCEWPTERNAADAVLSADAVPRRAGSVRNAGQTHGSARLRGAKA
jgi:hypothetical protein